MKSLTIYNADESDSLQIHSNTGLPTFWVDEIQGLESPLRRVIVTNRGGQHGAYIPTHFYGSRAITISGGLTSEVAATFESSRRSLENILSLERDSNGYPKLKIIKFTTLDDVLLQVRCAIQGLTMPIKRPNFAPYSIDAVGDYLIEAQSASTENFTAPSGGGAVVPFIVPVILAASSGSSKTITNSGTAEAWPIMTFTGPLTNPTMTNTTLGNSYFWGLTQTLASGDVVVADMREETCVLNGATPNIANKKTNSIWWWLQPGANNITLGTSNSGDAGSVTLSWRNSYTGV